MQGEESEFPGLTEYLSRSAFGSEHILGGCQDGGVVKS